MLRSTNHSDIENNLKDIPTNYYDAFIVSGGDGTINIVINCLMKYNLNHIPIAIVPSGTANDFATFLKLPKEPKDVCKIIENYKTIPVDVGLCNDMYFINVCAAGLFANVSEKIDKNFKEALGKFAYYIKALQEMHTSKPINLKITNSNETIEDKFDLFLVLNTSGTGSIKNLSPRASISDGVFDFVGFRNVGITNLPSVAIKYLKGEYLEHDKVLFFQDKEITIESKEELNSDLDGEKGPNLPINIKNIPNAIRVFVE